MFLPPDGIYILPGPRPELLPAHTEGLYMVLLRVEASDDKEADSNLAVAGVGSGIVHSGGVAGFPLPPLRYYVGAPSGAPNVSAVGIATVQLLAPLDNAALPGTRSVDFNWIPSAHALSYRLEVTDANGGEVLSALLLQGTTGYRSPPWLIGRAAGGVVRWRLLTLGPDEQPLGKSEWRSLQFEP